MTNTATTASHAEIGARVHRELQEFFAEKLEAMARIDSRCAAMSEVLRDFVLGGGKRLRPHFAYAAYRACLSEDSDSSLDDEHALRAVSALELIQACALIHDDIVDDSATRRGTPTVHVTMSHWHRDAQWRGDATDYGRSQAILIGDLALAWADEMFAAALADAPGITATIFRRAHYAWSAMKTEVLGGQQLDVLAEAESSADLETPRRVNRFKTAAYTIERPVHLGAVLAGAPEPTIEGLRNFGVDAGIAFQLVDDLLGVFGDPNVTGKPSGDDLREGKRTLLLNYSLAQCPPALASELSGLLGRPLSSAELDRARQILRESGAEDYVRAEAQRLMQAAQAALTALALQPSGAQSLRALADSVVNRAH